MRLRVHWSPSPEWPALETKCLSDALTSRVVRRFWGREWESQSDRRVTLDFTDVAYLNGLSDGRDEDTTRDAEALIDAICTYGEIVLELRGEKQ